MTNAPRALLLILVLLALFTALLWLAILRPMPTGRVGAFADRHGVRLTEANLPHISDALAVLHHWRRFGLASGLTLGGVWFALTQGQLKVDFGVLLLGWFVGGVIAQWRINAPATGPKRGAQLGVRSLSTYLPGWVRGTLTIVAGMLAALAAWAGWTTPSPDRGAWALHLAATLVGAGILWLVSRRVIGRPRPADPADVADADDALRSHSLATLGGAALALSAVPAWTFVTSVATPLIGTDAALAVALAVWLGLVALGWVVGHARRPGVAGA